MESSSTLSQKAYEDVRHDIIKGVLRPGEKLKLDRLKLRYGIGATPIREALNLLSSAGMVIRENQRGFRVAELTLGEYSDILEMRCWLEERALREAIAHGDNQWEEEILLAQHRLFKTRRLIEVEGETVESPEWDLRHQAFHAALLAACPSPILLRYCAELGDQNSRYCQLSHFAARPTRDVPAEHAEIARLAIARDADAATALLLQHYRLSGEALLAVLR